MIEFEKLFKSDTPLIDVRAPIEFDAGHFPSSSNLPLMKNEERQKVGTEYKSAGQAAALALGHSLVNRSVKDERVNLWTQFIEKNPHARLYCFRGGLRSEISSQWIREAGKSVEMIPGGYKALRHYLMETLETHSQNRSFLLLAGRTGSGKTQVLNKVTSPFLDLEKHANHKGSSFGGQGPQPAQITFENSIAVDLLKTRPDALILVEDEAVMIGTAVVPKFLFERMKRSPLLVLERSMGERVQTIAEEYVFEKTNYFLGDFRKTETFMLEALHRIQARLGGLNHTLIHTQITNAFASVDVKRAETHFDWIESLLTHYYDPLYDRGLKKSAERIAFQGNEVECLQYLKEKTKS